MTKVISIVGQKGGVGKTTIAVHLACVLAAQGLKTLIIDLDPQSSAALWGDRRGDRAPYVADVKASRLHKALDECRVAGIDVVVIDTAPHSNDIALKALEVADLVVIPCTPSLLDVHGTAQSLEAAKAAGVLDRCHVILNGVASNGGEADAVCEHFREEAGIPCAPVRLGYRKAWKRAVAEGLDVTEYEPSSKASGEAQLLARWAREALDI